MGGEVKHCPHKDRPSVISLSAFPDWHCCSECYGEFPPFRGEPFGGVHGYCGPTPGDIDASSGMPLLASERKLNIL